ncbi:hypothetical protein D3P09_15440 [Paenibacillus pinisoli]|uniref:Uncharacterized protein n=2 Tax=Paenibacillus pinisoli TaxID=1276110 RepID=A0A3A6PIJ2_9BACL|nr:hypothetical protein D3P09_15440 [Paenibacillus pinisoli]
MERMHSAMKRKSKGLIMGVLLLVIAMQLAGCSEVLQAMNKRESVSPVQASDFVHRFYLERDDYKEGDQVTFISELEYVGDRKSVTINHAMSPFYYGIQESTGKYTFMFVMPQPLIHTTLYPGKPLIEKYSNGWAYLNDGSDTIIGKPADIPFPAGNYTVVGSTDFNVGEFGEENENKEPMELTGKEVAFSVAP